MTLPNLIIPGGQKCGSSSLAYYLSCHPACCLSVPKEPSFFSRGKNSNLDEYAKHFSHASSEQIIFEASTGYLFESYAAERILHYLKPHQQHLKIIIILRNPVERCISAFLHQKKRFDDKRQFQEVFPYVSIDYQKAAAIEEENIYTSVESNDIDISRYNDRYDDPFWQFRYLQNSWYPDKIRPYIEFFGRESVHFLTLENLRKNAQEEMNKIFNFLQISIYKNTEFERHINPTYIPIGMDPFKRTNWYPFNTIFKRFSNKILPTLGRITAQKERSNQKFLIPYKERLDQILSDQYEQLEFLSGLKKEDFIL